MITDVKSALLGDLPFWDSAQPGEQCIVPCWPTLEGGEHEIEAIDCEHSAALVGVFGGDGLFRCEEVEAFNPGRFIWVCDKHDAWPGPGTIHTGLIEADNSPLVQGAFQILAEHGA